MNPDYPLRPQTESGQSLIELALCMPLFLVILLGSVEMANIAWDAIQVNNAARAGAQYASQSTINAATGNLANIQQAVENDAPTITFSSITSSQPCVCVDASGSTTAFACTQAACVSPNVIMDFVQVNAQATVKPVFHYPGLPASYILKGQATMGVVKP
jgi:Flp pilus assembly protein TadG